MRTEAGHIGRSQDDFSPEEIMWRTVILVFLQDIQKDYLIYKESLNGRRGKAYDNLQLHKNIAESDWLECICDFASINYEGFLEVVDRVTSGEQTVAINKQFQA